MQLDALAAAHGGLHDFRITAPAEVARLLSLLRDGAVPLNFNAPDGSAFAAVLWTLDAARGALSFSADAQDPLLHAVLACDEAVVVGYLDNVKLQFDVQDLLLVHGDSACALRCSFPHELWRFQRRGGYRVRPLLRHTPTATLRHPTLPDMQLTLRLLDLSIGGCALFLPDDVPPIDAGVQINGVQLTLDDDTTVAVSLRLQHVSGGGEARGVRLGCELLRPTPAAERALARYIDQTQKKRRLLALP